MIKNKTMELRRFCLLLTVLCLPLPACSASWDSKRSQGEVVIQKIEAFRAHQKRLPRSLTDVGVRESEDGPVYYRQITDTRYEVWYGTSLGESVTYDSERKTWE